MIITFQGVLMATVVIETILWIRSAWISDNRRIEIRELKQDYDGILAQYKNECVTSEMYRDIVCKRDNELSLWKKKYKKCIEYIRKINEQNNNK